MTEVRPREHVVWQTCVRSSETYFTIRVKQKAQMRFLYKIEFLRRLSQHGKHFSLLF